MEKLAFNVQAESNGFTCVAHTHLAAYVVCVGVHEWGVCPRRWVTGIIIHFYTVGLLWQGKMHTVIGTRSAIKWFSQARSSWKWQDEKVIWHRKTKQLTLVEISQGLSGLLRVWIYCYKKAAHHLLFMLQSGSQYGIFQWQKGHQNAGILCL